MKNFSENLKKWIEWSLGADRLMLLDGANVDVWVRAVTETGVIRPRLVTEGSAEAVAEELAMEDEGEQWVLLLVDGETWTPLQVSALVNATVRRLPWTAVGVVTGRLGTSFRLGEPAWTRIVMPAEETIH